MRYQVRLWNITKNLYAMECQEADSNVSMKSRSRYFPILGPYLSIVSYHESSFHFIGSIMHVSRSDYYYFMQFQKIGILPHKNQDQSDQTQLIYTMQSYTKQPSNTSKRCIQSEVSPSVQHGGCSTAAVGLPSRYLGITYGRCYSPGSSTTGVPHYSRQL
jgi:hypothetical protein